MSLKASKWIKRIAFILALCTLLCFTGCTGGGEELSSSDNSQVDEPENLHKVGFIFSGSADSANFASLMNEQRIMASNRCSMETCYVDNVTIGDFEKAVKLLADAGCTDIVSCSAVFTNVATVFAAKYMNLNFIIYGATIGTSNSLAYTEHIYQGAYVAGIAASYNTSKRKIGVVVDSDLIYDTAVTNAVTLGAQEVFESVTVYVAEAHADYQIRKAIDALINSGSDVIVTYTASEYAEEYCQQKGVKFIGNHNFTGREDRYSNMLMYYYCKRDSYFLAKFKQMQLDQLHTESYVGTMGNGVVTVSDVLGGRDNLQKLIDSIRPRLATGEAYIFDGRNGELVQDNGVVKCLKTDEMSLTEIYNMDWYLMGIVRLGSFREPNTTVVTNEYTVKQ